MTSQPFDVPDDFRAFMRAVVTHLELPADEKFVDDDEAFQHECGHGGRVDGAFHFTYITRDGKHRWELALDEEQIRGISDGLVIEVPGVRDDIVRTVQRQPRGVPLLVWGEYRDDALRIQRTEDLVTALDALHAAAVEPRMLRLWSTGDDQLVAILRGQACAIYVVESYDGYGTSCGSPSRVESFELVDHDGRPLVVPVADCVPWSLGRRALVQFAECGRLGPEIPLEGRIPSGLLMLGDADRAATIALRGEPPAEVAASSLARLARASDPFADWALGLIAGLRTHGLVAVAGGPVEAHVVDKLAGLLQFHGDDALESGQKADWLATELAQIRGVDRLDATGGDLQIALRRARQTVAALTPTPK